MAITALTLYVLWASLAFGWRSIDQRRRTGDSGLRLQAQPNTPQWWAKIGFGIAILVGLAAPIAAVAGIDNIAALDARWLHIAGLAVTVIGILCTVAAQYSMGESWRIGVDPHERTELVTHGAFGVVRNPDLQRHAHHRRRARHDHPKPDQHHRAGVARRRPRDASATRRGAIPPYRSRRDLSHIRADRRTIRSGRWAHPLNDRFRSAAIRSSFAGLVQYGVVTLRTLLPISSQWQRQMAVNHGHWRSV